MAFGSSVDHLPLALRAQPSGAVPSRRKPPRGSLPPAPGAKGEIAVNYRDDDLNSTDDVGLRDFKFGATGLLVLAGLAILVRDHLLSLRERPYRRPRRRAGHHRLRWLAARLGRGRHRGRGLHHRM